ncbi:MAG: hypothetical protein V4480_03020 [Patescibacteria group bacterium]
MTAQIKKLLSWSALALIVVVPLLMLFTMAMPMDHSTGGCPFMKGETSICPMSVLDHITSWQSTFTITLVEILTFALPIFALALIWLILPKPEHPPGYRRRSYPVPPLLQELFSSGLLNPRVP